MGGGARPTSSYSATTRLPEHGPAFKRIHVVRVTRDRAQVRLDRQQRALAPPQSFATILPPCRRSLPPQQLGGAAGIVMLFDAVFDQLHVRREDLVHGGCRRPPTPARSRDGTVPACACGLPSACGWAARYRSGALLESGVTSLSRRSSSMSFNLLRSATICHRRSACGSSSSKRSRTPIASRLANSGRSPGSAILVRPVACEQLTGHGRVAGQCPRQLLEDLVARPAISGSSERVAARIASRAGVARRWQPGPLLGLGPLERIGVAE